MFYTWLQRYSHKCKYSVQRLPHKCHILLTYLTSPCYSQCKQRKLGLKTVVNHTRTLTLWSVKYCVVSLDEVMTYMCLLNGLCITSWFRAWSLELWLFHVLCWKTDSPRLLYQSTKRVFHEHNICAISGILRKHDPWVERCVNEGVWTG